LFLTDTLFPTVKTLVGTIVCLLFESFLFKPFHAIEISNLSSKKFNQPDFLSKLPSSRSLVPLVSRETECCSASQMWIEVFISIFRVSR